MKTIQAFVRAAFLAASFTLPAAALAQSGQSANPADPQAAVRVLTYRSDIERYQAMAEDKKTPAENWRAANQTVAEFGAMVGMSMEEKPGGMEDMKGMSHGDMPLKMPAENPAKSDASATGHAHHRRGEENEK